MGALSEAIVNALEEFLRVLFGPITGLIERYANDLVRVVVETPHPNAVFGAPTNGVWPDLYAYYWDAIVPLSLLLWGLMIGLVILLESMSYLFSNYHRSKLKKRAVTGLLGILSWWWIAALSMQFMSGLAGFLVPDLSTISLFETLSFGALGVLGLSLTLTIDLVLFLLLALIYFTRHVVLYLFVLLTPLLIVFWIPGVGPFSLMSGFMKRLAGFYVPFLFMTVPVALLFRLGAIFGESFGLSMGGLGAWLTALVIPFAALVSPIILFWQAGALFFVGDRIAHRTSRQRATSRVQTAQGHGQTAAHGGQNFARGLRGEPAQTHGGQTTLGSGQSRAHAAGSRLNATGTRLHDAYSNRGGGGAVAGSSTQQGGSGASQQHSGSPSTGTASTGTDGQSPITIEPSSEQFDTLRNRNQSPDDQSTHRDDTDRGASERREN
ncbi:hypothetical protein SAMN06269185_2461 [Natronoarchaeum philippinense]|uniref:Type IV secretion system protein TrbL n=1 Tax=Natronoarchaeum philippinense TaxID=558529 RepID=A0A285P226_NATPI|nr:hypothetical protein [Natronoarchaeum philippinense]SNZ15337.1 hypothetical protein SAMN06269185_2461 [Natronoarchaeum philippinense]